MWRAINKSFYQGLYNAKTNTNKIKSVIMCLPENITRNGYLCVLFIVEGTIM